MATSRLPADLVPADTATRRIVLDVEGAGRFDEWVTAEIVRDLKDFAGSFSFQARDATRSIATFDFATPPPIFRLRPGPKVKVYVDGELVLSGAIDHVRPDIDDSRAEVTISGRDNAGDLVDCAAAAEGPGEMKNVKLDEAARRIAAPFGLTVKNEIDVGDVFARYPLELAETGLSAIEKGARQRHALVISDGTGGLVLTRTGGSRAPADLKLPGNVKSSSCDFSHENRHSKTVVRGQAEAAAGRRKGRRVPLDGTAEPLTPAARQANADSGSANSATERERLGTAVIGIAEDPEITRHRPIVHLAKTQADAKAASDEADWRSRTARAEGEELTHRVHDFRANGRLWTVNQLAFVDDAFQGINRDMLISRTRYTYDEKGAETELTLTSPEAFDAKPVEGRRTDKARAQKTEAKPKTAAAKAKAKSKKKGGPLDGTAEAL